MARPIRAFHCTLAPWPRSDFPPLRLHARRMRQPVHLCRHVASERGCDALAIQHRGVLRPLRCRGLAWGPSIAAQPCATAVSLPVSVSKSSRTRRVAWRTILGTRFVSLGLGRARELTPLPISPLALLDRFENANTSWADGKIGRLRDLVVGFLDRTRARISAGHLLGILLCAFPRASYRRRVDMSG
ncbi:hypothetical protein GY45DRAFT_208016 [Cubamyces sp. BRFM 1775]|nr:hypothetical protein GY45DRAFT_208016 [Cubamyces sp. BRFM 1775]